MDPVRTVYDLYWCWANLHEPKETFCAGIGACPIRFVLDKPFEMPKTFRAGHVIRPMLDQRIEEILFITFDILANIFCTPK